MMGDQASRGPGAERLRLIRLVHVAKKELHMVDDDYRALLRSASDGRNDTSSEMTAPELEKALSHLKRCGFKVRTAGKPATRKTKPHPSRPLADDPESKKIRALWLFLHELGAVGNPSEAALAAYVKRITRVDDLHWLTGEQAETVIETMKKWALRFLPGAVKAMASDPRLLDVGRDDLARICGLVGLAARRGTFDPMAEAWKALTEHLKRVGA